MNARRFFHLSAGVLCLTLAFAVGRMTAGGPELAVASLVDLSFPGVVAIDQVGSEPYVLDESGQVWRLNTDGWQHFAGYDVPFSLGDIKLWTREGLVTTNNEAYRTNGGSWVSIGFWPGGPTPAEKTTWSKVKSEFK